MKYKDLTIGQCLSKFYIPQVVILNFYIYIFTANLLLLQILVIGHQSFYWKHDKDQSLIVSW